MHLHFTLLLPLLTSVLALPTNNITATTNTTSASNLEKRYSHGWIGSFSNFKCTGDPIGDRPKITKWDCIKFHQDKNAHGAIGVFFGTGTYHMPLVRFFEDENCKTNFPGMNQWMNPGKDNKACGTQFVGVGSVMWDSDDN